MKFTKRILCASLLSTTLSVGAYAGEHMSDEQRALKDAWLDGKSEATLLMSRHLNNFTIDTQVERGVVTLSGVVDSEIDKHLAEELVLNVDGVKSVDNQLKISSRSSLTDSMLADMKDAKTESLVKARLLMDTEVSGSSIEVEVEQGKVILSGEVSSGAEKELAEAIAENTSNVDAVVNRLHVNS